MTSHTPKYNMAKNPVYQVDCSFGASGKKVAATKRRIRFRFGFSSAEALAEGATGTACRGEEHEVTLTWSLTSGKRIVMADGIEVHFSKGPRAETKFETSWTMNGQHTIKLVAHAAPPLRAVPGFRQFDLQLDGLSYFDMPKIYELGIKTNQMVPAMQSFAEPPAYNNYSLPGHYEHHPTYEQPEYGRHHYVEDRREPERPVIKKDAPLRSPTSVMDGTQSSPQDLVSEITPVQGVEDLIASPVYSTSAPTTTYDEFTPVEPVEQPRSTSVVHNDILSAYGPPQTNSELLALTNGEQVPPAMAPPSYSPAADTSAPSTYVSPTYATPPPQYTRFSAPQYNNVQSTPQYTAEAPVESPPAVVSPPSGPQQLSMNQLMDAPIEEEPVDEMDRALKNLVNIDDIAEEVKAPERKKVDEKRAANMNKGKSKPLPPTTPSWHLGLKPALSEIKANAPAREAPPKEVMRTHAFDPRAAQAGMLVLYGAPQISSPGFGIPAQMQQQQQYYMYAQQQKQQMYAAY